MVQWAANTLVTNTDWAVSAGHDENGRGRPVGPPGPPTRHVIQQSKQAHQLRSSREFRANLGIFYLDCPLTSNLARRDTRGGGGISTNFVPTKTDGTCLPAAVRGCMIRSDQAGCGTVSGGRPREVISSGENWPAHGQASDALLPIAAARTARPREPARRRRTLHQPALRRRWPSGP
jgi:hypothetical protein